MGNNATTGTGLAEPVDDTQTDADVVTSPSQGAEPERGRRWAWWVIVAVIVGYAIHLAWRIWLAQSVTSPVAHADEDRYLLSARVLAGGVGGLGNDTAAFRRMGYPLVLSPIYNFTNDPFKVYHAAQIIGAAFNALAFPLAYLFARRVFDVANRWWALAVAFVAATLPAIAYYSEFTLTDVMFAPIGLAWLLLLHGWLAGRTAVSRAAAAIGTGAVLGYAYTVHIRGAIMVGAHLLALAYLVWRQRSRWKLAAASLATTAVLSQGNTLLNKLTEKNMITGGVEPQGRLLDRFTDAMQLVHLLCDAVGQIWYLGIGTWGLGAIAVVVAVNRVLGRDRVEADFPQRFVLGVLLGSTVLIALGSAAALPEDGRVSNHAYFRYIAFLAPIYVMLAITALIKADRKYVLRTVGQAFAGIAVATFLLLTQINDLYEEWFHPFDTPETSFLTYSWDLFRPANATIIGVVLMVAFAFLFSGSRKLIGVALAGVLLLNVVGMEVVNAKSVRPMAEEQYGTAPQLVKDLKIGRNDVITTSVKVSLGPRLNHQREIYWTRITEFNHRVEPPPANATVVIVPWHSRNKDDWDGTAQGWRRAAGDARGEWTVWLRQDDPRFNGQLSPGKGQ